MTNKEKEVELEYQKTKITAAVVGLVVIILAYSDILPS